MDEAMIGTFMEIEFPHRYSLNRKQQNQETSYNEPEQAAKSVAFG